MSDRALFFFLSFSTFVRLSVLFLSLSLFDFYRYVSVLRSFILVQVLYTVMLVCVYFFIFQASWMENTGYRIFEIRVVIDFVARSKNITRLCLKNERI